MTKSTTWPPVVQQYLRALKLDLASLPEEFRRDILAGVTAHISDSLEQGDDAERVLSVLGSHAEVATQAFDQYERESGVNPRPRYFSLKRVLQIVAFVFTIAAALVVIFLPGSIEVSQDSTGRQAVTTPTLIQSSGGAILVPLLIPVILTVIPLLVRNRGWQATSIVATVILAVFAIIASASIGMFYLPAVVAAVTSLFIPSRKRIKPSAL